MDKGLLRKKLIEISDAIENEPINHIGVLSGISGVSLFRFYYSKYLGVSRHSNIGNNILQQIISKINDGYNTPSYCTGLAGFGWVLNHLDDQQFVDFDCDNFFPIIDGYLQERMMLDMKNGNFDFLHGGLGYSYYFLLRYQSTKSEKLKNEYKQTLERFIISLEQLSISAGDNKRKWLSVLDTNTEDVYNLSLSHGMSSIVGILTKLYQHDCFKKRVGYLLNSSVNYILDYRSPKADSISIFPNLVAKNGEINYPSRLSWCYGDLGIGVRLWFAGKALSDGRLKNIAIEILKHATKRISPSESFVRDAGICHGSFGIAQIFHRMHKETNNPVFAEAMEFWIKDGLEKATHKDGFAGFKQWKEFDKEWKGDFSLLEGVSGIGLVLIDYLANFDVEWDNCLMIS